MRRGGQRAAVEPGSGPRERYEYENHMQPYPNHVEEEGVEVVLDAQVTTVMEERSSSHSRPHSNQNVFRAPPSSSHAVRPRAMRPPSQGPPMPPAVMGSGSFGHGPPSQYPPHSMAVPYNPSGSFDDHHSQQNYSPHVQYPHGGRYQSEDVNVISPSHGKVDSRPPRMSQSRGPPAQYYQYPPTSPVSRPVVPHSSSQQHYGRHHPEGPYAAAQRQQTSTYHPDDGTFNSYPPASSSGEQRPHPPLVTESSFDSEHHASSQYSSHPPTPGGGHPAAPGSMQYNPQQQFYGGGGSWGSFDSGAPPPHFDDQRYYGYAPSSSYPPPYSPGPGYYGEPYPTSYPSYTPHSHSYDEDEHGLLRDYHPDRDGHHYTAATVTPGDSRRNGSSPHGSTGTPVQSNRSDSGMLLPPAAYEVDFEVTNPPTKPVLPPSMHPIGASSAEINEEDVLCGRGGGTNSQIGNRRFRKLVQDFQPTYLLARRKEKPLLARTIVLIIRKRGGRFIRKDDDTGELYEVGDVKAEAKTSQALREGLDVRATKSAASSLMDKKKKKKQGSKSKDGEQEEERDEGTKSPEAKSPGTKSPEAKSEEPEDVAPDKREDDQERAKTPPPALPALKEGEGMSGIVHPHSPDALQFRKRRRMRSKEGAVKPEDTLFADFCPPRADLCRTSSPEPGSPTAMNMATTPPARNIDEGVGCLPQPGCSSIAMEIIGAAAGGLCLGPSKWRPSS